MSIKCTFTCVECGAEFERYPSQVKNLSRPYCSNACVGASKRHGSTLFCALCDNQFYRRYGEQDRNVRVYQFCSKACYHEWRVLYMKSNTYPKSGARHKHRIIAEEFLKRPLTADEVVHHIDGNKHNCNPSNLAVLPDQSYHMRVHQGGIDHEELRRFSLQ